ncbi:MAG: BMC domain-containing protein [Lachnospiraceae bacterium]
MQALGFIETKGLVAAIESADAMLKAAEVHLVERTFVKGGIVTITVTGDIAACKASVDAAASAVSRMGGTILSTHVIPRPHESLDGLIIGSAGSGQKTEEELNDDEESHI